MDESIVFGPTIDDRQLDREVDSVNDALEDVGRISPNMDTSGLGGMGGGGVGMNSGIPGQISSLVPMADYRNRLLEDILDTGQMGGGGGGGTGIIGRLSSLLKGGLGILGGGGILGSIGAGLFTGFNIGEALFGGTDISEELWAPLTEGRAPNLGEIIDGDLSSVLNVDTFRGIIPDEILDFNLTVPEFLRGGISLQVPQWLRGVTQTLQDINPFDPSNRGGGGGGGPLSGLFDGPLYQGPDPFNLGPAGTPGQRAGANFLDQRFRNDPAANPSQVNRRPLDITANINLDPSGLNDLQRNLKRELENDLVPQITQQIERSLSIGGGGR